MKKLMIVLLSLLLCTSVAQGASKAHWGYSGHEGPENWGELSSSYKMCSEGSQQSPINVENAVQTDLPAILFSYENVPVDVLNNGHTIQANYKSGSAMKVNGRAYDLKQFHFHAPSENTIKGKSFPLEAHLVHADKDGNLAVVGIMFDEGANNEIVKQVWEYMPETAGAKNTANKETVNVQSMLPSNPEYYTFSGSLTTPPCSEGVLWHIFKEPVEVASGQIEKFKSVMHHPNNRPVQPVNGRMIFK